MKRQNKNIIKLEAYLKKLSKSIKKIDTEKVRKN